MVRAPLIPDVERRARLVARHHLGRTAPDVLAAVRGVVALHSTDPVTPYLGLRARVSGFATGDLDRALLDERALWRLHAMRRTLFVVPTEGAAAFEAGASRDVARRERSRLEGWLAAEMDAARVPSFLAALEARVLEVLGDGSERGTGELTAAVPRLGTQLTLGSGRWTTRAPLSSRLLFLMAMDGRIVRTRAAGSWRSSQYRWAAAPAWFDPAPAPMDPEPARAELARRYLAACGPAMLDDVRWWTGWTAKHARAALAAVDAVTVRLEDGGEGLVLPGDEEPRAMHGETAASLAPEAGSAHPGAEPGAGDARPPGASPVALLPSLDPTPMGWKRRDWFLGPHAAALFDRNGNIGPSVWADGRIIGGWAQRPDGEVVHRLLEDVGAETERAVAAEAASLTEWLRDVVVIPRFRTPLERELSA